MALYHLKLKTQKVQSFIFKVPKLKAMLGANSLLGEFFAKDLPDIREKLPCCETWKKNYPKNDLGDYVWENDNLKSNFDQSVICSAGGHFETLFDNEGDAKTFITNAYSTAEEKIPGIRISLVLKKYENFNMEMTDKEFNDVSAGQIIEPDLSTTDIHINIPYFYPSGEDGENPELIKGHRQKQHNSNADHDSKITMHLKQQGDLFYKGETKDYLCRFLKNQTNAEENKSLNDFFADDLNVLASLSLIPDNNKIAVIAIDGNAMGKRFTEKRNSCKEIKIFDAMTAFEKFWFKQRNTFREALKNTLDQIVMQPCLSLNCETKKFPYQVMMMGGDDLLLITVPEIAIDFATTFGEEITKINEELSVAAGIAFVKSSFPFTHAHSLAENLLSSAKVKSRTWTDKDDHDSHHTVERYRNTIDWHIHFPSGTLDIDAIRLQNYFLQYSNKTEILTSRPCIMDQASSIWNDAKKLHEKIKRQADATGDTQENSLGRNKYKRLRSLLKTGEENVKLYSSLLKLEEIGKQYLNFDPVISNIEGHNGDIKLNSALDVIELAELHNQKDKEAETEEAEDETN